MDHRGGFDTSSSRQPSLWARSTTQAIVPPGKAGAASGIVLTVLVGMGGIALAVTGSVIETRGGPGLDSAINDLMRISGAFALVGAALTATIGRSEAHERPATRR